LAVGKRRSEEVRKRRNEETGKRGNEEKKNQTRLNLFLFTFYRWVFGVKKSLVPRPNRFSGQKQGKGQAKILRWQDSIYSKAHGQGLNAKKQQK
jgi:hypothetical protein